MLCLSRRQLLKSQDFEMVPARATLRSGPPEGLSRWDRRGFFFYQRCTRGRAFHTITRSEFCCFQSPDFFLISHAHTSTYISQQLAPSLISFIFLPHLCHCWRWRVGYSSSPGREFPSTMPSDETRHLYIAEAYTLHFFGFWKAAWTTHGLDMRG